MQIDTLLRAASAAKLTVNLTHPGLRQPGDAHGEKVVALHCACRTSVVDGRGATLQEAIDACAVEFGADLKAPCPGAHDSTPEGRALALRILAGEQ